MTDGFEEYVKLKLLGKETDEVNFKVGVWTKMDTLKKMFSSCQSVPVERLRFEFNGRRINGDITPWNLDLKDGDVIDVFVESPHASSADDFIFIRLTGLCGERCLRVKQSVTFGKIIKYFSDWKHAPESALKFVYNHKRISYEDTPWKLKIKDNDAIEVAQDNEESIDQLDQNHVVIKLLGNDPDIFGVNGKHFKMKQTTNMGRLFDYYNEKYNIPESMLKFFFDGARIHYNDTPEKLGIKNNDLVQACLEAHQQTGKENSFIKIKAVYSDDTLLRFKVRPRTKFRKLKKHYSEFVGVPVDYLRFLFFETTINDDDTPEKLKMKNEVVIEVISDRRAPLSSANF